MEQGALTRKPIRTCKRGLAPTPLAPLIIFDGRVWWSKPRESSNLIVFAVMNEHFYPQWSRLTSKAQTLDKRYRLDLTWVVTNTRRREDPDG